ncbi:hypothetical protein PSI23_08700 [Xenorhabdus sp. XENO-10]|uniref:ABC transporter permease n=1 Tax=Xenorhabdus yunnanensis TaxID=3025878 RepID=A0ABT5LE98_9GAMM|nr:hypothetical protein [Xenorhabdus yunnanensis]MDC9589399.1 hypothetical protein [Xenorhabdus yunnanensis]
MFKKLTLLKLAKAIIRKRAILPVFIIYIVFTISIAFIIYMLLYSFITQLSDIGWLYSL